MEPNDPLPQATVDPEPPAAQSPTSSPRGPEPTVAKKLVPVRQQVVRAVPRQPEIVKRQATVRYFRKMRKGKVSALAVRLDEAGSKDDAPATREGTVCVEPIIPGSLVYPSHAELSTQPGSEARFTVLPLCRGKVRVARVEFRTRGKTAESLRLPVKVIRRGLAWLMLLFTVAFTGLLAWDRHVSAFEPIFEDTVRELPNAVPAAAPQQQQRGTTDPRSGGQAPRPGTAEGIVQPPVQPANGSVSTMPKTLKYRGEPAIDKWIEHRAKRSSTSWEGGNSEVTDLAVLGLDAVHGWKFGAEMSSDYKDASVLTWAYRGWGILHNLPMCELYLGVFLLTLTALVWFMQGPARGRRKSGVFELSIP